MKPDEMHQSDNPSKSNDEIALVLWPQARGELLGFALHLDRKGMTITSAQIRLAVELADKAFEELKK